MENNQLQLVTFEQAQRLKKMGFDWNTRWHYRNDIPSPPDTVLCSTNGVDRDYNASVRKVAAPTVAFALKWMRDVKDIVTAIGDVHDIEVGDKLRYKACFCGYGLKNHIFCGMHKDEYGMTQSGEYRTYEAAESALLDELLTLIEK